MATGGRDIRAGRAYIELGLKGFDEVKNKLRNLGRNLRSVFQLIAKAAAAVGAAVAGTLAVFVKMGDALDKMAARLDIPVESLSRLKFAAENAGTSLDAVAQAAFRARRRIANATTGTGPAVRALKEMRIEATRLNALNAEQQLEEIIRALNAVEDPARRSQLAFEIFGDNWREIKPLIDAGADSLRNAGKRAEELGLVMSTEDAAAAAKLGDDFRILWQQVKLFVFQLGALINETFEVGESLKWLSEQLGVLLKFIRDDEIGKAWEFMWKGMARTTLAVIQAMIEPIAEFLNWILDQMNRVIGPMAKIGADIARAVGMEETARWLDRVARNAQKPTDVLESMEQLIDKLTADLKRLENEARKQRPDQQQQAGIPDLAATAAGGDIWGSFDPSAVLRHTIGVRATEDRIADATERTAVATESMDLRFRASWRARTRALAWR